MPVQSVSGLHFRICENTNRQVLEARRAQITHRIGVDVVVEELPVRRTCLVSFSDVKVVSLHVNWEHRVLIELNELEAGAAAAKSRNRRADFSNKDWLLRVRHAVANLVVLFVSVARDTEPDDVLETLHQCTIPDTKLVLTVRRSVVSKHNGETTSSFNIQKRLLKPSELVSRILALTHKIPVERVTDIRVVGDDTRASWKTFSILELSDLFRVETILSILSGNIFTKPFRPVLFDVID